MLNSKPIFLFGALVGGFFLGSSSFDAETGELTLQEAHAAEFTGRIRNVRIRRRKTAVDYFRVVNTGGSESASISEVRTEFTSLNGGPALPDLVDALPRSSSLPVTFNVSAISPSSTESYALTTSLPSTTNPDESHEFALKGLTVDGDWAEDASGLGLGIKARLVSNNDDTVSLDVRIIDVEASDELPSPAVGRELLTGNTELLTEDEKPLSVSGATGDEIFQTWKSKLNPELSAAADGFDYQVTTRAYDKEGTVIATLSEELSFNEKIEDLAVEKVTLKETDSGKFKATVITGGSVNTSSGLEIQVTSGDELLIDSLELTPVSNTVWFANTSLGFSGDLNGDVIYPMTVDLNDAKEPLGISTTVELRFNCLGDVDCTFPNGKDAPEGTVATFDLFKGQGFGYITQDAEGDFQTNVSLSLDEVQSVVTVQLGFQNLTKGSGPTQANPEMGIIKSWSKWIAKSKNVPAEGATVSATVRAFGENADVLLDSFTGAGSSSAPGDANFRVSLDNPKSAFESKGAFGEIIIDDMPLEFD